MRQYRPGSWSNIARRAADYQVKQYFYYTEEYIPSDETMAIDSEWVNEVTDVNHYLKFLRNYNSEKIIRYRAIKRFVRTMKKRGVL